MSAKQETNVAINFFNIHAIITRGLQVSLESARNIIQGGFQGETTREGFFNYLHCLTRIMNAHHLTEDHVAFPYFRVKLPDVPFDDWTYWHGKMDETLEEIRVADEKCQKGDDFEAGMRDIEIGLVNLNEGWPFHIGPEEEDFITKADALIPVEEQRRLVKLFTDYLLEHSDPLHLTVPFMLYNLPEGDRKGFSHWLPAESVLDLIPVVWKEKWASMAPLMLA